jgi:hypothetical protein
MNATQQAVNKKFSSILAQLNRPLTYLEEGLLIEQLKTLKDSQTIWGLAISRHFEKGDGDHRALIDQLADQCKDDIFTMASIVGETNAVLLLRSTIN